LRTKKCGTGVNQVLKYSTGDSRSRKLIDRTIIPSSSGIAIEPVCPEDVAHESKLEPPFRPIAAVDRCLRNSRLEVMKVSSGL
jgi:hypothetical protein